MCVRERESQLSTTWYFFKRGFICRINWVSWLPPHNYATAGRAAYMHACMLRVHAGLVPSFHLVFMCYCCYCCCCWYCVRGARCRAIFLSEVVSNWRSQYLWTVEFLATTIRFTYTYYICKTSFYFWAFFLRFERINPNFRDCLPFVLAWSVPSHLLLHVRTNLFLCRGGGGQCEELLRAP